MRQLAAVIFYLFAGLFLIVWGGAAYAAGYQLQTWTGSMLVMAPFALGPLVVGATISPGARLRETGIVLLVAGMLLGLGMAMIAVVLLSSGLSGLLPPGSKEIDAFGNPIPGVLFNVAMIGAGVFLVLRKPQPTTSL